jgi:uridine phosphorylase
MTQVDPDKLLPALKLRPRDLTPHVLVVGDPNRVRDTAAFLGDVQEIGNNREYLTVTGEYRGRRLTVASHGVGAGGANVCFMELLNGGARLLIRAGTCGALAEDIADGDFIIATGAVREDKATEQLMPLAYPALADRHVVEALIAAAQANGYPKPHVGLGVTAANLYSTPVVPAPWPQYVGYGVLAIEMELAALLVLAQMNGARAGGILASDGNLVRKSATEVDNYDPHRDVVERGKRAMLKVGLDALAELAGKELPA